MNKEEIRAAKVLLEYLGLDDNIESVVWYYHHDYLTTHTVEGKAAVYYYDGVITGLIYVNDHVIIDDSDHIDSLMHF